MWSGLLVVEPGSGAETAEEPAAAEHAAVAALRRGMRQGELAVLYQPVVRIADRRPLMVEALVRWNRPEPVATPEFVALAERSGLAHELTVLVVRTTLEEIAPHSHRLGIGVSINLPLELLLRPELPSRLRAMVQRHGMRPRQVAIELTETTPVRDLSRLAAALARLGRAGFRVLLDDVALHDGRQRLWRLGFAALKLDRSLVERLPHESRVRRELRGLLRGAAARGQLVIAEGVTDRRLWAALRALGVHHAQGFGVGRPITADALPGWWAGWRGRRLGGQA